MRWATWCGALVLAGCAGGLPHPPYRPQATGALARVDVGPPPGRVETVPPRPAGADAWIDGEWILRHRRSYWLLGRWVKVPDGASYAPWVIVRSADGTVYYAPSVWLDKHATPVAPPPGLAFATASGGVVVDPRGNPQETGRNVETPPPAPPSAP